MILLHENGRPRAGLDTASRGRLRVVGPLQVGRKMGLADMFPDDALRPLSQMGQPTSLSSAELWFFIAAPPLRRAATGWTGVASLLASEPRFRGPS